MISNQIKSFLCQRSGQRRAALASTQALANNTKCLLLRSLSSSTDDTTFDYVVVGAGSAGCVIANRLSKDPKNKVIVLEAGGKDNYPWIHIPLGYLYTMKHPRTSWGFNTTVQDGLNGRSLWYPRGKVLGGCSSINGMIYQRGQRKDYDTWQELTSGDQWGWNDMKKYFNQSLDYSNEFVENDMTDANDINDANDEDNETPWSDLQGGEWHVEKQRLSWQVLDDFKIACEESNIPNRAHFNSSDKEGCGYFQVNQRDGFRLSSYGAFLKPVLQRSNLSVRTNVHVDRLLFDPSSLMEEGSSRSGSSGSRAAGILVTNTKTGEQSTIRANKEIILAAGAIGSPHILQCSGIGDRDLLNKMNIPGITFDNGNDNKNGNNNEKMYFHLPGVGQNLQDHLQIRSAYKLKEGTITLNSWKKAGSLFGQAMLGIE
jgi:choline dehydrogenase